MTLIFNHVLNLFGIIDFCRRGGEEVDGEEMSRGEDRCTKTNRQSKVV